MNSLTDCFFSGIHHLVERCHSRLVITPDFFFEMSNLLNVGPGFGSRRSHVQRSHGKHRMVLQSA